VTLEPLTATEARVAGLVVRGYADGQISAELAIPPRTLEGHLADVYRKLGVRSRTELALLLGAGARDGSRSGRGGAADPHPARLPMNVATTPGCRDDLSKAGRDPGTVLREEMT
jgi:DNA-binding CsgD family transcriptional regulator